METLLSFGTAKFTRTGYADIVLSNARGNVIQSPVYINAGGTNIDLRIIKRLRGFRHSIPIETYNIKDTDGAKLQELMIMLNSTINNSSQETIIVYPRYDSTATVNLNYECVLDSSVNIQDLANVAIGQKVSLSFTAIEILPLSTVTSDSILSNWVDESDNRLVDESGNYLILKND